MATIYETELKQDKDGAWYRWVGVNAKGTKQKFRLGKDKTEAKRRLRLVIALFESQVEVAEFYGGTWVPEYLKSAKMIAKGKQATLPRMSLKVNEEDSIQESPQTYAKHLAFLNRDGEVFTPANSKDLVEAVRAVEGDQRRDRLIKSKLIGTNPDRDPTGQNIGQAIDAFIDSINTSCTSPEDESLSTWGKTQIDQLKSWKRFMSVGQVTELNLLETDLADLTIARAQKMVDVIRTRPMTFESKRTKRMTVKSASGIKKKIRSFFDWLDIEDQWQWWEPPRFRKVKYSTTPLTSEEKHQRNLRKERWRISDDEMKILFEYATPVERVLLLLGLNCAFGAGEIGDLRIPYVKLDEGQIDGIRFKTGIDSRHSLWPETIEGLRWELARREKLPKSDTSKDVLFLADRGAPLWRKLKSGNYKNGVAKRWRDLMDRIKKDHPDFHQYSFGKLRKTAAIRVIEISNAEAASMILGHGVPTDDKLLSAYVSIPWEKLFAAQKAYGDGVRPLLKTKRPPFEQPPKNYIGKKAEQILEQFKQGIPVQQIARELGIHPMTVYRHVDRAELREKTNGEPE